MKRNKTDTLKHIIKLVLDSEHSDLYGTWGWNYTSKSVEFDTSPPTVKQTLGRNGFRGPVPPSVSVQMCFKVMVRDPDQEIDLDDQGNQISKEYIDYVQGSFSVTGGKGVENLELSTSLSFESQTGYSHTPDYHRRGLVIMNRLGQVFQLVENYLESVEVFESESDFDWVQGMEDREKKKEEDKKRSVEIDGLEELGEYVMNMVAEEYHGSKEEGVKGGITEFLKEKGGTDEQVEDVLYKIRCLGNDKSELSGSPDRNVVERFDENLKEFEKVMIAILGQEDFDECEIWF